METTPQGDRVARVPIVGSDDPPVDGYIAPGFEAAAEVFRQNFAEGLELGAAFAVSLNGTSVVDLWGGWTTEASDVPWNAETICAVFSGTKGLVSVCLALLIERGAMDLDMPVSHYWAEFGKDEVTVREVVSHTSRLPAITRDRVNIEEFLNSRKMAHYLEAEPLSTDPRARCCYHAFTFGWLCAELVRRIDGRDIRTFFAEDVAAPLDLELWIGLPEHLLARTARLSLHQSWRNAPFFSDSVQRVDGLVRDIFGNPDVLSERSFIWNEPRALRAGVPGAGAVGTARSMADLYGRLPELLQPRTIDLVSRPIAGGLFAPLAASQRFGVGFQLSEPTHTLGAVDRIIGHTGAGGSVHGRWLDRGIGFSYVTNLLRDAEEPSRSARLLDALLECLA